jgi:chromosomal replication initiation ATPase DnaA
MVGVREIVGKDRRHQVILARQEFYDLAYEAGASLPQIGRFCGDRDHTTVRWGVLRQRARIAAAFAQEAA